MKNSKIRVAFAERLNSEELPGGDIFAPYFWKKGVTFAPDRNVFKLSREDWEMLLGQKFPVDADHFGDYYRHFLGSMGAGDVMFPEHTTVFRDIFEFVTYKEAHELEGRYIVALAVADLHNGISGILKTGEKLPVEVRKDIKSGKAVLLVDCPWEGFYTTEPMVDLLDKFVWENGLAGAKDHIWLLSNIAGGPIYEYLTSKSRLFSFKTVYHFENFIWGEHPESIEKVPFGPVNTRFDNLEKHINETLEQPFDKKFLCLAGALREHRMYLYALINSNPELQENCISSFRDHYSVGKYILDPATEERSFVRAADEHLDNFIHEMWVSGNTKKEVEGDTGNIYSVFGQGIRNRCFIEIVSETSYTKNLIGFTEKTFKPFLSKKPFILVGAAGSLEKLKQLGYKTFGDFWDESYDTIECPVERIRAIGKLILDLNKKSFEELREMQKGMRDIFDHNFRVVSSNDRISEYISWLYSLVDPDVVSTDYSHNPII